MIQIALWEKIIIALVNIFGFFLAFWVFRADKKNRLNQWFFGWQRIKNGGVKKANRESKSFVI